MSCKYIKKQICKSSKTIAGFTVDANENVYFTLARDGLWKVNENENNGVPQSLVKIRGSERLPIVWNANDNAIYICESGGSRLFQYSVNTGKLSTFAGSLKGGHQDGDLKDATFSCPSAIAVDKNGDLYITEAGQNVIRKVNMEKKIVESVPECISTTDAVTVRGGTIYAVSARKNQITKIKNGITSTINFASNLDDIHPFEIIIIMETDETCLIGYERGLLLRLNISNNRVDTIIELNENFFFRHLALDREGNLFVATTGGCLWKFTPIWRYSRYLWIGHLKEEGYCPLSTIPTDIIKEIARHIQ